MKTFEVNLGGIASPNMLLMAERKMKKHKNARCLIKAFNGQELYIKENDKVRVSTEKEWKDFWTT